MAKQEFYDKSGISSGSFSQWRTGTHTPSLKKLQCAANALNVSLDYILYGEEVKPVEPDEKDAKKDLPHGEVNEKVRKIFDFAESGAPEEIDAVLDYIEFLRSRRKK